MIVADLVPMHKFISTDVIGNRYFNKYSVGYIYASSPHPRGEKAAYQLRGLITRIGKTGKNRLRPVDFRATPVVVKKLVDTGFYEDCTFVVAKPECVSVLNMSDFDFLAWSYTKILDLEHRKLKHIVPDPYDQVLKRTRTMGRHFEGFRPVDAAVLFGTAAKRKHIVQQLQYLDTFVRKHGVQNPNGLSVILQRHYDRCGSEPLMKKINTCLEGLKEHKELPKEVQMESANVLHEYENSGHWF